MKKVTSRDGTPIAYYRSSTGPPLVLIQGTGAASPAAWPAFPALEERFSVIVVDRRGRGESGDGSPYAIEREFEDIAAVVDAVQEPVHLLGHSFGGLLALEAALLTHNIDKLVLYEPSIPVPGIPAYPEGIIDRYQALLETGDWEALLITHYRDVAGMAPEEIEQLRSSPAWAERLATAHTLPRESWAVDRYVFEPKRFEDLRVPVLLLVGSDSAEIDTKPIEVVRAALSNSRVAVMPGQRHIAMYTAPELFVNELVRFLLEL